MEVRIRGHGSNIPTIQFYSLKVQIDFHSKYDYGEMENHKLYKARANLTKKNLKKRDKKTSKFCPF